MKKSYIKSKNLSKRIAMAIALGVSMPAVVAGVASANTTYQVGDHTSYEDTNDLNGTSTTGTNIVELGSSALGDKSGAVVLGNIILGNSVVDPSELSGAEGATLSKVNYPNPSKMNITGDSVTVGNVNVFTLVHGNYNTYTPSFLNVHVDGDASFNNMTNTPVSSLIIPNKALGGNDDQSTTLNTDGLVNKNANITVQANNITAKTITVKGTSGNGDSSSFSYTASGDIKADAINTEADANVTLSADKDIQLGSVTRTAGADEGDSVTPGITNIANVEKLTIGSLDIKEGSFTAVNVSDTVTINNDINASSDTKTVSVSIKASNGAKIKGSTAKGAKASISITGDGVEASGIVKSLGGGETSLNGGSKSISVGGAEADDNNSKVKLSSEYDDVSINGDAVSKSGGAIEASSDYGKVTVTGAVDVTGGAKTTINAASGDSEVGSVSAIGAQSTAEIKGNSVTVDHTLTANKKGTINLTSSSGSVTVGDGINAKGANINITASNAATVGAVVAEADENNVLGNITIDGGSGKVTAASAKASGAGSIANLTGEDAEVTNGVEADGGAQTTVKATSGESKAGSVSATGDNSKVEISGNSVAVDHTLTANKKGTINLTSSSDGVTVGDGINAKGANINITANRDATVGAVVAETDENNVLGKVTIDGGSGKVTAVSAKASGAGSIANLTGNEAEVTGALEVDSGGQSSVKATSGDSKAGSVSATGDNSKVEISGNSVAVDHTLTANKKGTINLTSSSDGVTVSDGINAKGANINITANSDATVGAVVAETDENNVLGKVTIDGGSGKVTAASAKASGAGSIANLTGNEAEVTGALEVDSGGQSSVKATSGESKVGSVSGTGANSKIAIEGQSATISGDVTTGDKATTKITADEAASISGNVSSADKASTEIKSNNGAVDIGEYGNSTVEANGGSVTVTAASGVTVGGAVSATAKENNGGSVSLDAGSDEVKVGGSSATGENSKITLKGTTATVSGDVSSADKATTNITATDSAATISGDVTTGDKATTKITAGGSASISGNVSSGEKASTEIKANNGAVNIGEYGNSTVEANGGSVTVTATSGVTVGGAVSATAKENNGGSVSLDAGSDEVKVGGSSATGENSKIELKGTTATVSGDVSSADKATTNITATNGAVDIGEYGNSTVEADGGSVNVTASSGVSVGGGVTATYSDNNTGSANIDGGDGGVVIGSNTDSTNTNVEATGGNVALTGKSGVTVNGDITSTLQDNVAGVVKVDGGTGEAKLGNASATGENSKVEIKGASATLTGGVIAKDKASTKITATDGGVTIDQYGVNDVKAEGATVAITGSSGVEVGGSVSATNDGTNAGSTTVDGGTGEVNIGQYNKDGGNVSATGENSKVEIKGATATLGGNVMAADNASTKINVTGDVTIGEFNKNGGNVQAIGDKSQVEINGGNAALGGSVIAIDKASTKINMTGGVTIGQYNGGDVGARGATVVVKGDKGVLVNGAVSAANNGDDVGLATVDGGNGAAQVINAGATGEASQTGIKGASVLVANNVLAENKGTVNINASSGTATVGNLRNGQIDAHGGTVHVTATSGATVDGVIIVRTNDDDVAGVATVDGGNGKTSLGRGVANGTGSQLSINGTGVEAIGLVGASGGATTTVDGKSGKTTIGIGAATGAGSKLSITGTGVESTGNMEVYKGATVDVDGKTGKSEIDNANATDDGSVMNIKGATTVITDQVIALNKSKINILASDGAAVVGGDAEQGLVEAEAGTVDIKGSNGANIRGTISSQASSAGVGEISVDGGAGKVTTIGIGATGGSKATMTGIGAEVDEMAIANDGATTIIDGKTGDVKTDRTGSIGKNSHLEIKGNKATIATVVKSDQEGNTNITAANGVTIGNGILSDNGGNTIVDGGTGEALIGTDDLVAERLTANHKGNINVLGNSATVNGSLGTNEGGTINLDGKSGAASVYGDINTNSKDKNNKNAITVEGSTANVAGDINVKNGKVTVKGKKTLGGSTTVVNVNVNANGAVDLGDGKTDTIIKGNVSTAKGLTPDAPAEVNIHGKSITYIGDKDITANANSTINVGDKDSTESIAFKEASANGDNSVVNIKAKGEATINTIKADKGGKINLDTKPANITTVLADGDGSEAKIDSNGVIGNIDKALASNKGKIVLHTTDIFTLESKDKPNLSTTKGGRITIKADKGIIAKTKITANGVDYTSKGEVKIMDVDTDPNNPNSTEISGKDVTTGDFNAKAGGSIGVTGDRSINVDGNIIADGKDANIEVAHKHNELKLLAAPGKLIEAKNGGHIVLTSPDGIDITAPNVIADGEAISPKAQPGTSGKLSTGIKPSTPGKQSVVVNPSTSGKPSSVVSPSNPGKQSSAISPSAPGKASAEVNPSTPGKASAVVSPSNPGKPSAAIKPSTPPKTTTITIGTVDGANNPTVTKDIKLLDLEAYHGGDVNLASQAEIKVEAAKTNTEGQIRFYSTKAKGDGVTITNLSTVEATSRPEPKPVVKKQAETKVAKASPVVAPEPATPTKPEFASIIISSRNSHVVNLTGAPMNEKVGRILLKDAGDTLSVDNFKAGTQEFGLDIKYSPKAIKTINPASTVESNRLIIKNGTSTPQTLAIGDIAFNQAFDTLTAAKEQAKKQGNRRFTPLIPFAAVLNPNGSENTFRVNVAPIKWNQGKELKDRLVVQRKPYNHHKFAPQFKNYFNKLSDNELIYFVALKVIPDKIFVDSVLTNGEQIYNLATGDNLGINRGYGMLKGIQANNAVGVWAEVNTSRVGYKDLNNGTLTGVNIGYNLKANKKSTVGISIDYAKNSGSLAWTSTDNNSKLLALNVYKHGTLKDNLYYSLQGRLGQAKASFACNDDGEIVTGNQKATFGQIAGEVDKMKNLGKGKYLSTQGEVRITRIGGKDYDASNEVTLKADNITSLLSRVGMVFGQEKTNPKGLKSSYYISANLFHEFAGNIKVMTVDDIGEEYNYEVKNQGTWGSLGIGYKAQLTAKASAFLDYGHTFGGHRSIGTLHVGAKWLF